MTLPCTDSSSKPKAKLNFGHLLPSSPHALSSSPANVLGKKRDFVCTTSGTSFSGRATPPALPKRSRKEQSDKVNDIDASDVPDFGAARSESDVTNDVLKVLQKIKVPKQKRPNVGEGDLRAISEIVLVISFLFSMPFFGDSESIGQNY